jgi:hypothetical protein
MEIIEESEKTIRTKTVVAIVCDLCKRQQKGDSFESKPFELIEIEVKSRIGTSYPEGGSAQEISYDLCPACFERLDEWLRSQGAAPSVKRVEW